MTYDDWKTASPPEHPQQNLIADAENAAREIARKNPEFDRSEIEANADDYDENIVYVDLTIRLKVYVGDGRPETLYQDASAALLALADRVGTPHREESLLDRGKRPR